MKKFKPFSGFCPVPVLPSSQVAATSYMQHLAYLEWYIEQLRKSIEAGTVVANPEIAGTEPDLTALQIGDTVYKIPEAVAPLGSGELLEVQGLATNVGSDTLELPVFSQFSNTDKLTVDNGKIKIGAGVKYVKVSGVIQCMYSGAALSSGMNITINGGTTVAVGFNYFPAGVSNVTTVSIPDQIVNVDENDTIEALLINFSTGFSSVVLTAKLIIEVIDE